LQCLSLWSLLFLVFFLTLIESEECANVTIHVQDSCGNPVITKVCVVDEWGQIVGSGWTDDNGDYQICLENGLYYTFAIIPTTGEPTRNHYFNVPDTTYVIIIINGNCTEPVGGISIPVNKLELLAPYLGLTILSAVAIVAVVYVKKRKRHTEINS